MRPTRSDNSACAAGCRAATAAAWLTPGMANGAATLSIEVMRSGWAMAYPTRRPASPYAFDIVRLTKTFGNSFNRVTPLTVAPTSMNSVYASSSTTSTVEGTAARNARISASVFTVPVGLFGLAINTTLVRSLTTAASASKSSELFFSGACTSVAPTERVKIGYASKLRQLNATSLPGPANAFSD